MKHPIHDGNEINPFGSLTPEEFYTRHSVSHHTEYITNSRGFKLFTQWWTPLPPTKPTAVICIIHGYTGEIAGFVECTAVYFAENGPYTVCAIDHQGHGFSEGLFAHIPDINHIIDDCISFFDSFREKHIPLNLPSFIYSESLGGAIALLITLRRGDSAPKRRFDGILLNGSMCGINDEFIPPWPFMHLLGVLAYLIPTWCVCPTRGNIPDISFKVEWKRKLANSSPRRPELRPRPGTAYELIRVCKELQSRFSEVDVPFLISHGGDDIICDPKSAKELYQRAASEDKTLKIYPNMLHQLIGEDEENVELVFGDMLEWIQARVVYGAAKVVNGGIHVENGGI